MGIYLVSYVSPTRPRGQGQGALRGSLKTGTMFETHFGFVPASAMMSRNYFLNVVSRSPGICALHSLQRPVLDPQDPRVVGVPGSSNQPVYAGSSDAHRSLRTQSPELSRN